MANNQPKRIALLLGGVLLAAAAVQSLASTRLANITQLLAGSGLTGGGTGPTVTLGIAPGAVTSAHVQDGTLQVADLAPAAVSALRGAVGPAGPAGPTGPEGVPGPAGPAGTSPAPIVINAVLTNGWQTPVDAFIDPLTRTFTLTEAKTMRINVQVTFWGYGQSIQVALNNQAIGYATTQTANQTLAVARTLRLQPGTYTVQTAATGQWDLGTVVVGYPQGPPATFMDVELQ